MEINPYDILDISPMASTAEIKARFRSLALMYHPDKCNLTFIGEDYFNEIQKAYRSLMKTRRDSRMPDYDIKYENIEQELDAEMREILDMNENDSNNFVVNIESDTQNYFNNEFNRRFMEVNRAFRDLRPWEKGYSDWNRVPKGNDVIKEFDINDITYKNLFVNEFRKPEVNDSFNESDPDTQHFIPKSNYGLVRIDDFSVEDVGKKNNLHGGDLEKSFSNRITESYDQIKTSDENQKSLENLLDEKLRERTDEDYEFPSKEDAEVMMSREKQSEKNHENNIKQAMDEQKANEEYIGIFGKIKKSIGWI